MDVLHAIIMVVVVVVLMAFTKLIILLKFVNLVQASVMNAHLKLYAHHAN
jgi:hypothetical protein